MGHIMFRFYFKNPAEVVIYLTVPTSLHCHPHQFLRMSIIKIDHQSAKPIYKQIVDRVERGIYSRELPKNYRLQSINKVCRANGISRDSVLLAYQALKKKGVIHAIPGKGYYVRTQAINYENKYFLLFDELNAFKEDLYNSFLITLKEKAIVEIYFHHFNMNVFEKLIHDAKGNYSKYIIMPSNLKGAEKAIAILPDTDVYILDQTRRSLASYPCIYQNFISAMYQSLQTASKLLKKYDRMVLIHPGQKEPLGMVTGFNHYCTDQYFEHQVIRSFQDQQPEKGTVYLTPDDRDLVDIVEKSHRLNLRIGKDVGIISYNDTALKKVVANGITTISTDFGAMGARLAEMVWKQESIKIENPSRLILRKSL
jgi:DNA-binding transcriptional regulator YhcF (GntR family)